MGFTEWITRKSIPPALVKEVFRPATVPPHQLHFLRFLGVWINLAQIFSEPVRIHFYPRHGLKRPLHLIESFIDQPQHFMSPFQFTANVCMMNDAICHSVS